MAGSLEGEEVVDEWQKGLDPKKNLKLVARMMLMVLLLQLSDHFRPASSTQVELFNFNSGHQKSLNLTFLQLSKIIYFDFSPIARPGGSFALI